MNTTTQTHIQIQIARAALRKARDELSALLVSHVSDAKHRDPEFSELEALHLRVKQAHALLPHGGEG